MKNTTILLIIFLVVLILFAMNKPINAALKLTRGYRNNNPGNIRKTFDSKGNQTFWKGEIKGTDKDFKTFSSMAWGYRALAALLKEYNSKGFDTITKILNRYAPTNENDTNSYIKGVSKQTGLLPDEKVNVNNVTTLKNLVAAISYHENGIRPDLNDIDKGFNLLT